MFLGFASDNTSGVHPRIMQAVAEANRGYDKSYGEDAYTVLARREFCKLLGDDIAVFFVLSGTGANVLSLRPLLRPWQSVICADASHINSDESGAPEFALGSKLHPVPAVDGKLTPACIDLFLHDFASCHKPTPRVLSITQTTEKGTVYTPAEVRALADKAHAHGLLVHMDGTRIANAVAALNCDVRAVTRDCGVDVMTFGGTKNGLLLGEAVIFFADGLAEDFLTVRKQSLQLVSKLRFISAQFVEYLKDGLWLENARHANRMAAELADRLASFPFIRVSPPAANTIYAVIEPKYLDALHEAYHFYELDPATREARFMCSFATTAEEIDSFVSYIKSLI